MEEEAIMRKKLIAYGNKLRDKYASSFKNPPSLKDLPHILSVIIEKNDLEFPDPSTFWKKTLKSDAQSQEFRASGNESLRKQNYSRALSLYTKALIYAESNVSRAYALALANRSVALSKLRMFSEAYEDAKRCLDTKAYPEEYKLHIRQAKCLEELREPKRALAKYETAISLMPRDHNPSDIQESIKSLKKDLIVDSFMNVSLETSCKPPSFEYLHRYMSPKVSVKYDEFQGRYAVANSFIDVGEEIVVDKAACRALQPWHALDHCFLCLSHTLNSLPCEHCVGAIFCSNECKKQSQKLHSDFDCKLGILDSYAGGSYNGAGHANQFYMAYKLLSMKGSARFFIENAPRMKIYPDKTSVANLCKAGEEEEEDELQTYQYMCSLVAHDENFWRTLSTVFFVLKLLDLQGFWDDLGDCPNVLSDVFNNECRDPRVYIGTLIYQFYLGILSNNHSISEVLSVEMNVKLRSIGIAVFPLAASLFNHACDPNTVPVYDGPRQITLASRPIQPGESICHIYQGHFADTLKIDRQRTLKDMFHFECQCEACRLDYPLSSGLKSTYSSCEDHELLQSLSQDQLVELDKQHLDLSERIQEELLENNNVEKALELYQKRIRIASKILKRPHMIFVCGRAAISDCLFYLYSNKSKLIKDTERISGVYQI